MLYSINIILIHQFKQLNEMNPTLYLLTLLPLQMVNPILNTESIISKHHLHSISLSPYKYINDSPSWPGTHYTDQYVYDELIEIPLPLLPEYWEGARKVF